MTGFDVFILIAVGFSFGFSLLNWLNDTARERELDDVYSRITDCELRLINLTPAAKPAKVTNIKKKR